MQPLIQPRRTRDEVMKVLRALIAKGDFKAGGRLEEVELSKRLGVSRTPVREALIALETEGWVAAIPNRGVRVVAADQRMVIELYPILAALEGEAIRASGDALAGSVTQLREINRKLAIETRRPRQHALDAAFHRALTGKCGNARLLQQIAVHWRLAGRFDGAGERGTANQQGSCAEHDTIIDAIERSDFDDAANLLRAHWYGGIAVVTEWLRG